MPVSVGDFIRREHLFATRSQVSGCQQSGSAYEVFLVAYGSRILCEVHQNAHGSLLRKHHDQSQALPVERRHLFNI